VGDHAQDVDDVGQLRGRCPRVPAADPGQRQPVIDPEVFQAGERGLEVRVRDEALALRGSSMLARDTLLEGKNLMPGGAKGGGVSMRSGNAERRGSATDQPRGWQVALRGLPGHPLHPPLTDATIGMFVLSAGLAVIGYAGAIKEPAGKAMWLALIGGLIVAVPAATTGLVDWLFIQWGTPRWKTATAHMTAMVTAVALFALAAWQQHSGYLHGGVTTAGFVLSLAGLAVLTVGGWLGGSVVFVHGTRVIRADDVGPR